MKLFRIMVFALLVFLATIGVGLSGAAPVMTMKGISRSQDVVQREQIDPQRTRKKDQKAIK